MSSEQTSLKIRTQTTYNAASDHYDEAPFWDRYGRRTVERLRLVPGWQVLDVGCGTGASAISAAEQVASNGRVTGVDLAENLLAIARAKAAKQGLQNIEFRSGDMENLDFPDGHFDAVVSVFSIFFVTDMENQVRKLWRLVRPGGLLAITTWGPDFCEPMHARWAEAIGRVRPGLYSGFRPWDRLTTPESLKKLLLDGGVPEAEVVAESGNQTLQSPEDWWAIVLGTGFRWTMNQLGDELSAQVREDNLIWAAEHHIREIETNVVYAAARK